MTEIDNFIQNAYMYKRAHIMAHYKGVEVYAKISHEYWAKLRSSIDFPRFSCDNSQELEDEGIQGVIFDVKIMACSQKHDCTFLFKEVV